MVLWCCGLSQGTGPALEKGALPAMPLSLMIPLRMCRGAGLRQGHARGTEAADMPPLGFQMHGGNGFRRTP